MVIFLDILHCTAGPWGNFAAMSIPGKIDKCLKCFPPCCFRIMGFKLFGNVLITLPRLIADVFYRGSHRLLNSYERLSVTNLHSGASLFYYVFFPVHRRNEWIGRHASNAENEKFIFPKASPHFEQHIWKMMERNVLNPCRKTLKVRTHLSTSHFCLFLV